MSAFTDRITPDDIRWLRSQVLADPTDFPREFTGWVPPWVALAGLDVPLSQIQGFVQFAAQPNVIATSETTLSASYTDLTTTGPSLTGLPDGAYVVLFGAAVSSGAGNAATMSIQVNSTSASDNDSIEAGSLGFVSIARAVTKTLANDGNSSITAKYKATSGDSGNFKRRWLIALRYANA